MFALIRSGEMYDNTLTEPKTAGGPYRDRTCDLGIKSLIQGYLHLSLYVITSCHMSRSNATYWTFSLLISTYQLPSLRQSLRELCGNGEIFSLKRSQLFTICCAFDFLTTSTLYVVQK
jgi:hypothetical protein